MQPADPLLVGARLTAAFSIGNPQENAAERNANLLASGADTSTFSARQRLGSCIATRYAFGQAVERYSDAGASLIYLVDGDNPNCHG